MADVVKETTQVVLEGDTAADGYSYKVDLYTGDLWGAGTDANVLLTIYGEDGNSNQRVLDNEGNNFERDSKDHFQIVCDSHLGRIQKIRIGHDDSGVGAAWFLSKVTIEDVKTREVFEFPCDRWFSEDEDDGSISRELTWTNVTVKEKEEGEAYSYTIHIFTGDPWGSGTDSNVHVTIYGTKGESGEHRFENEGKSTFENSMKNSFNVESISPLGTLYKVRVGHDNTGWGPAWFLDKVEVEDGSTGEIVEFACGKWLSTDSEDGLIRRDLMREGFVEDIGTSLENVTYTVTMFTGTSFGAGTDANIRFTLYGTAGESEQQTFENEGSTTLENGMEDVIKFGCPYLGMLTKLRIGHDNTGWGPAWELDKVTVDDPKTGETAVFPCNRWLATNADDGMIERELTREGMFGDNIIIEGMPDDLEGEPLGLETNEITDDSITASSHADASPPSHARLNNTSGWCAGVAEGSWLQVDLGTPHCVTSVATQGNPVGNNDYVKKYKLQYSQDGENWDYPEENGNQLFDANEDHCTVKTIDLQKAIVARYVRFCPVEWHRWPCMRVEIYGIPLKEGGTEVRTVSYVTEQVVIVEEEDKNDSVPEQKEEQNRAEDVILNILSQTGDKRKSIDEQKKQIDDDMQTIEVERKEREKQKDEERKKREEQARKEEEEKEKKRQEEEEKKKREEEERRLKVDFEMKKIEEEHRIRLDELDRKIKEDEERKRKELEEKKKADDEELARLDEERKRIEDEVKRRKEEEEDRRNEERKLRGGESTTIITTETKTDFHDGTPDDGGDVVTITREIVLESFEDEEKKDEDDEEERKRREKEEKEIEREEKRKHILEEEEKRQKEEDDFNELMLKMRIKAEGEEEERKRKEEEKRKKEEEEEKKKKEEAKRIKEKEEQREEREKEKKQEKAKRRAEKEKKRILIKQRKTGSDESLSSLSSSSSSSSSEDDGGKNWVSNVENEGFKAPIAQLDDEDESVTKVVTFRTNTTTTTRIVSWPGTYFFRPIEPHAGQQPLPEDAGLLFGIDNVNPYKGMPCCDHLKPVDLVVKNAQESSFCQKLGDNAGPLPVWYGGLDTQSTMQISAIRDEDLDRLVEWEKAGTQGWKKTKKSRDFEIWKRKAFDGGPPITKAIITLNGVPYTNAVEILRDWNTRKDWDKTFDKVEVLENVEATTVVHCPVKKREFFLAVLDRQEGEEEEPYFASAWRNTSHPNIDQTKSKKLKLYYLVSGLVIRPVGDGSQSSVVTLICQVKGSVPSRAKGTFLAANPAKWSDSIKKHHANKTKESAAKEE